MDKFVASFLSGICNTTLETEYESWQEYLENITHEGIGGREVPPTEEEKEIHAYRQAEIIEEWLEQGGSDRLDLRMAKMIDSLVQYHFNGFDFNDDSTVARNYEKFYRWLDYRWDPAWGMRGND